MVAVHGVRQSNAARDSKVEAKKTKANGEKWPRGGLHSKGQHCCSRVCSLARAAVKRSKK